MRKVEVLKYAAYIFQQEQKHFLLELEVEDGREIGFQFITKRKVAG